MQRTEFSVTGTYSYLPCIYVVAAYNRRKERLWIEDLSVTHQKDVESDVQHQTEFEEVQISAHSMPSNIGGSISNPKCFSVSHARCSLEVGQPSVYTFQANVSFLVGSEQLFI